MFRKRYSESAEDYHPEGLGEELFQALHPLHHFPADLSLHGLCSVGGSVGAFPCVLRIVGDEALDWQRTEQVERETAPSDVEDVKGCLRSWGRSGLFPRLVSSRRGHHMPPQKKKADVAIRVEHPIEGPETHLW